MPIQFIKGYQINEISIFQIRSLLISFRLKLYVELRFIIIPTLKTTFSR